MLMLQRWMGTGLAVLASSILARSSGFTLSIGDDDQADLISDETIDLAVELGLEPDALVLAEVSVQTVQEVLGRIEDAESLQASIRSTRAQLDEHLLNMAGAMSILQLSPDDSTARSRYDQALRGLAATQQSLDPLLAELREAATAEILTEAQVLAVDLHHDRLQFGASVEMHACDVPDEELKDLADVERRERRCLRLGESLCEEDEALLMTARMDQEVIMARVLLDANLSAMSAIYDAD